MFLRIQLTVYFLAGLALAMIGIAALWQGDVRFLSTRMGLSLNNIVGIIAALVLFLGLFASQADETQRNEDERYRSLLARSYKIAFWLAIFGAVASQLMAQFHEISIAALYVFLIMILLSAQMLSFVVLMMKA